MKNDYKLLVTNDCDILLSLSPRVAVLPYGHLFVCFTNECEEVLPINILSFVINSPKKFDSYRFPNMLVRVFFI